MGSIRNRLRREKVIALFRKQNGLCHWCGGKMLLDCSPHADLFATCDHLDKKRTLEARLGWKQERRRFVAAHRLCNNHRHYDDKISHRAVLAIAKSLFFS